MRLIYVQLYERFEHYREGSMGKVIVKGRFFLLNKGKLYRIL